MRDMNFFTPFKTQKGRVKDGRVMRVLIALIIISLIVIPATLYLMLSKLNNDISAIKGVLNMPKNLAIINTLDETSAQVASSKAELDRLYLSNTYVKGQQWFRDELLKTVIDTLPKQIKLTELTLSTTMVTDPANKETPPYEVNGFVIRGNASDKPAVAEFEYNVRQTGQFKDIFVYTIENEEGLLTFDVQFNVKDGAEQ